MSESASRPIAASNRRSSWYRLSTLISSVLVLAGCGDRTPPSILDIAIEPNENASAPLAARLSLRASEPVRVALVMDDGRDQWSSVVSTELASELDVPVLGLRSDTDHRISVVLSDAAGNEATSDPIEFRTEPLPDDFPRLVPTKDLSGEMEPGVTLFNLMKVGEGGGNGFGAVLAVDGQGEIIWYYRADHGVGDVIQLANGNLLYNSGRNGVATEIDMLGNVVERWHATGTPKETSEEGTPVDTDTFHHEIAELPSGTLLTVSSELRTYDDYPTSSIDPDAPTESATVVGDVLVEFDRDGTVLREVRLLDVLDPYRTASNPTVGGGFWESSYEGMYEGRLVDWAHVNAAFYDERDRSVIVSARRQDAVVKVDLSTGQLAWILGDHAGWTEDWAPYLLEPSGEVVWPNHQHAAKVTPHGTILLFDNGTNRGGPVADGPPISELYSRAVEYAVDESTMEVSQVWSYGDHEGDYFYSSFISDADWLPRTGNVLVTDGARITDAQGMATDASDAHRSARIVEVTHTTPPQKVFELVIEDDAPKGWHVYRAVRLPSLYRVPSDR